MTKIALFSKKFAAGVEIFKKRFNQRQKPKNSMV